MKIDGGCHCGKIAYEAEVDPDRVNICHCTDCQHLSGTAFRTVIGANEGTFRITRGEPRIYVKTAESGKKRAQAFCTDCGTQLYATQAEGSEPRIYGIRVGTSRQRGELAPRTAIWHRSALRWLDGIGSLPKAEKQSRSG